MIKNVVFFKWIFFSLPFLYSILYAPYGLDDFDTAFVAGLSWQFLSGSIPYEEITYVRPPVTYMFHSLPLLLSTNYGYFLDRCLAFFQIATYSYLAILLLAREAKQEGNLPYVYFLASLSFILTAHNFPVMSWHATDGIFFTVIGIFFLISYSGKPISIIVGAGFLVLGALSKQPYYLFPIISLGLVYARYGVKHVWILLVSLIIMFVGFFVYLETLGAISSFIRLTTGQTTILDLVIVGLLIYIESINYGVFVFLPPLMLSMVASKMNIRVALSKFFVYLVLWILIFSMYFHLNSSIFYGPLLQFPHTLFVVSMVMVLRKLYKKRSKKDLLIFVLLLVAWASSISWGYTTPVFFMAPMLFFFGSEIYEYFEEKNYKIVAFLLIILGIVTFYIAFQNPYNIGHEARRSTLIYSMEEIYPKLKYIYGDKETYMEYGELKSLIKKYGDNFAVLPSVTAIHFLSETRNPMGIDWCSNVETNRELGRITKLLESKRSVVFLKKKEVETQVGKFGSEVSEYIEKRWRKIDSGSFFDVYVQKDVKESK